MRIERFWVEVNARVNYPIKNALRNMEEADEIDMDLEETKFCVSAVAKKFAKLGLEQVVHSWNNHPITGEWFASTEFSLSKFKVNVKSKNIE